ncbi:hypothetical protein CVT26_008424 [Gymnopilus dilepis]|uniref:TEA domain-containing protein n=1 Tax=Gymnopilus dilepis TaxID=231916 RepID=A0A409YFT5_9AGAR|nr:hypothetical protein CVT26_008424 [Gymnopilus dilepis]
MPSKAEPIGELGAGRLGNFCPYYSGSAFRAANKLRAGGGLTFAEFQKASRHSKPIRWLGFLPSPVIVTEFEDLPLRQKRLRERKNPIGTKPPSVFDSTMIQTMHWARRTYAPAAASGQPSIWSYVAPLRRSALQVVALIHATIQWSRIDSFWIGIGLDHVNKGSGCDRDFSTPPIATQSDKTGRRSYKMMRSAESENLKAKKEPVWPPVCEDALLEGLRLYKPVSKSGRPLRRFVKRNVFIALHIFRKTGKRRTAKQVGSRLQQISESSRDEESYKVDTVKRLITNRDFPADEIFSEVDPNLEISSGPSTPSVLTPSTEYPDPSLTIGMGSLDFCSDMGMGSFHSIEPLSLTAVDFDFDSGSSPHALSPLNIPDAGFGLGVPSPPSESMSLLVELLSATCPAGVSAQLGLDADITPHSVDIILSLNITTTTSSSSISSSESSTSSSSSHINARKLSDIPFTSLFSQPPTLTLVSPLLSVEKAYFGTFGVYLDAASPVHSEMVTVVAEPTTAEECTGSEVVWRTRMVPGLWASLCSSPDLDRYTIVLDISELPSTSSDCTEITSTLSVAFNMKETSPLPLSSVSTLSSSSSSLATQPSSSGSLAQQDASLLLHQPDTFSTLVQPPSAYMLDGVSDASMSMPMPMPIPSPTASFPTDPGNSRMHAWLESTCSFQPGYNNYGVGVVDQGLSLERHYFEGLDGFGVPRY